ncbi:MAG: DUF1569 domain-containing protein [Bacteroidetes bacterium]|nr:DUF1569 domain-containing protein [Bacteroidota bacterium]
MKTLFDPGTREELINRINKIEKCNTAQWGKMTSYQMLKHCALWEEMALGKKTYKRVFIGRLFGKMALRVVLKDDKPLSHNSPTIPELKIIGDGDLASEKRKWIDLINEYAHFSDHNFVHPFFGKMTKEQIGWMSYKHADHHLRQFES